MNSICIQCSEKIECPSEPEQMIWLNALLDVGIQCFFGGKTEEGLGHMAVAKAMGDGHMAGLAPGEKAAEEWLCLIGKRLWIDIFPPVIDKAAEVANPATSARILKIFMEAMKFCMEHLRDTATGRTYFYVGAFCCSPIADWLDAQMDWADIEGASGSWSAESAAPHIAELKSMTIVNSQGKSVDYLEASTRFDGIFDCKELAAIVDDYFERMEARDVGLMDEQVQLWGCLQMVWCPFSHLAWAGDIDSGDSAFLRTMQYAERGPPGSDHALMPDGRPRGTTAAWMGHYCYGGFMMQRKDELRKYLDDWNLNYHEVDEGTGCQLGFSDPDGIGQFDGVRSDGSSGALAHPTQFCYMVWKAMLASLLLDDSADAATMKRMIPSARKLWPMATDGGQETYTLRQGMFPGVRFWDGEPGHSATYLAAECHLKVGNFDEALEHNEYGGANYFCVAFYWAFQKGRILAARAKAQGPRDGNAVEQIEALFERAIAEGQGRFGSPLMAALGLKELIVLNPQDMKRQSRYQECVFELTMDTDTPLRKCLEE